MSQFFAMGGYAAFVWPAYGVTTLVLLGLLLGAVLRLRRNRKRVAELEAARPDVAARQP